MILQVLPATQLKGKVSLPASKSYSLRAFLIAACGGVSKIIRPSNSEDARVAMTVARELGAVVRCLTPDTWIVKASAAFKKRNAKTRKFHVGESGTVLRFLLPLLALRYHKASVMGQQTLIGRPNHHLLKTLRRCGLDIHGNGDKESVPIHLKGGEWRARRIEIEGTLSSQFVSALLIACPQLSHDSQLVIRGQRVVSADYIKMTQTILKKTGVKIRQVHSRLYRIQGGQRFKGLGRFTVPSDEGLAAFLMAAGILLPSQIRLEGHFDTRLIQADGRIFQFLKKMGAKIHKTHRSLHIHGPATLKGGTFSLKDCPDLLPVMAVLALFAKGKTRLINVWHARAKESDRISDLRQELLKIGAKVSEKPNELCIMPQSFYRHQVTLDPHRDHRLAMAFCVLGLRLGVTVKGIECVKKSYPDFVKDFRRIGARVRPPA